MLLSIYSRLKNKGDEVIFMWVPAHMSIVGNEKVDKIAKMALKKSIEYRSSHLPFKIRRKEYSVGKSY